MNEPDIKRLLELIGASRIRSDHGNVNCACPFAPHLHARGTDRKPSFGVQISPTGPSPFNCLACGIRGRNASELVEKLQRFKILNDLSSDPDLADAISSEVIVGYMNSTQWAEDSLHARQQEERLEEETIWPEDNLDGFDPYSDYVRSRGISEETAITWGVLFDPDDNRVLFPIRNAEGQLVGVTSKYIETGDKINALAYNRADYLYGQHLYEEISAVVIVEGQFDALTVHQAGFPVYAILGNTMTENQALFIRNKGIRRVVLLLDGDEGGRTGDVQISKLLQEVFLIPTTCIRLPDEADPNSLGSNTLRKHLSHPSLQLPPIDRVSA